MAEDLERALATAVEAAREAGRLLRDELHRPSGPRGHGAHADVDAEAERIIHDRLLAAFPSSGYLGEELSRGRGAARAAPGALVWLVDPNDGTADFLKGARGSAVSIGALRDGVPVLGVIFAFAYPDDDGDLIAWAEGAGPLCRNGRPVAVDGLSARRLDDPAAVVILSAGANRVVEPNLACTTPARFRARPSIAYRLALAAVGEAVAGASVHGTAAWDFAAGHALLRAGGGVLLDERAQPVGYRADGSGSCGRCFGGAPAAAAALAAAGERWDRALGSHPVPSAESPFQRPGVGRLVRDPGVLSRAEGCLAGQVAGDSLGSLVEFQTAAAIAGRYPKGVRDLADGGTYDTLAGQPTDDSEMALALARSIAALGRYDRGAALDAYVAWYESGPFDAGNTTSTALHTAAAAGPDPAARLAAVERRALRDSQANGSLMRASPLGVALAGRPAAEVAAAARADSALTHPAPVCADACAAFVVAIAHAVSAGDGPAAAYEAALRWARAAPAEPDVLASLEAAREALPRDFQTQMGWVRIALQNAFYRLLHAPSLEEGVIATVGCGGDTDTNGAIAGALLGAVHGREAVPLRWRSAVLSCRATGAAPRPRPPVCWPIDVYELAERLLACR